MFLILSTNKYIKHIVGGRKKNEEEGERAKAGEGMGETNQKFMGLTSKICMSIVTYSEADFISDFTISPTVLQSEILFKYHQVIMMSIC